MLFYFHCIFFHSLWGGASRAGPPIKSTDTSSVKALAGIVLYLCIYVYLCMCFIYIPIYVYVSWNLMFVSTLIYMFLWFVCGCKFYRFKSKRDIFLNYYCYYYIFQMYLNIKLNSMLSLYIDIECMHLCFCFCICTCVLYIYYKCVYL